MHCQRKDGVPSDYKDLNKLYFFSLQTNVSYMFLISVVYCISPRNHYLFELMIIPKQYHHPILENSKI